MTRAGQGKRAVLDLFAGSGWGVALQQLDVPEYGVEIMKEAIETRRINGMETVYTDAWDIDLAAALDFDTMIASPSCQSFSMAGKGSGRKALDDVLKAIEDRRFESMDELRRLAEEVGDERTAHVLIPLAYIHRYRPIYVALEQVPTVMPVWRAYAEVLEGWGYSVWTDVMHAEQYGVPQTRKRAILIARRDGKTVKPPVPTHSRYYSHDPKRLDPGVEKWVSMAEALGRLAERPAPTVTGGGIMTGGWEPFGPGGRRAIKTSLSSAITGKAEIQQSEACA